LIDADNQTVRQVMTDVLGARQQVLGHLERIKETRRVLNTASVTLVDHANVTCVLEAYGKAKAAYQETGMELPRFERQLRGWLLQALSAEERAACEEIAANVAQVRDAAQSMSQKAERLRAAASAALRQSRR
jgi:hypothetical protein